jgi:hypothetical protein
MSQTYSLLITDQYLLVTRNYSSWSVVFLYCILWFYSCFVFSTNTFQFYVLMKIMLRSPSLVKLACSGYKFKTFFTTLLPDIPRIFCPSVYIVIAVSGFGPSAFFLSVLAIYVDSFSLRQTYLFLPIFLQPLWGNVFLTFSFFWPFFRFVSYLNLHIHYYTYF